MKREYRRSRTGKVTGKKALTLLLAGMLALNVAACGSSTTNNNNTESAVESVQAEETMTQSVEETAAKEAEDSDQQTVEEATEAAAEASETSSEDEGKAFTALMESISLVRPGTAGSSVRGEEAADALVDYVQRFGDDLDSDTIQRMAAEWLENSGMAAADLGECLTSVIDIASAKDSALAEGDMFTKVIEGIRSAVNVYPQEGMDGGDVDDAAEAMEKRSEDFHELMDSIYGIHPGTAGSSLKSESAASQMVTFAFTYAAGSQVSGLDTLAANWFAENSDVDLDEFAECLEAADSAAQESDDSLAEDVAYQRVLEAIRSGLN